VHFVRSPLTLSLKIAEPILLGSISWVTKVGQQEADLFELWARQNAEGEFVRLGRGRVGSRQVESIVFFNPRSGVVERSDAFCVRMTNCGRLESVTELQIKILSTVRSTTPCLRDLHIWARPKDANSRRQRQQIMTPTSFFKETLVESDGQQDEFVGKSVEQELMDALTCEPMSIPLVLPSGQIVDQSTLNKFVQNEAAWGRPASDPFTGKPFTNECKPVLLDRNAE
jgi:hypothetical protein